MNHLLILSTLCLTLSANADDLRRALDPWGKRLNPIELKQRKNEVEAETSQRRLQLPQAQHEHNEVLHKLAAQRERIEQLRAVLKGILAQEDVRLAELVERQKNQTEYSAKVLASGKTLEGSILAISKNILDLKTHAEVARILAPELANTEENRALWIAALKQIEQHPEATPQAKANAKKLLEKVQKSDDWIWSRPDDLMSGYIRILEQFHSNVNQGLMENLLAAAQQMTSNLNAQHEIQKSLLEALQKLKLTHDTMSGELN